MDYQTDHELYSSNGSIEYHSLFLKFKPVIKITEYGINRVNDTLSIESNMIV